MGSPRYRLPWTHWLHLLRPQCKVAGRRSLGRSHQSSRSTSHQRQLQAASRQRLLWIAFLQILQCMPYQILWWSQRLWSIFLQLLQCMSHQLMWWSTSLQRLHLLLSRNTLLPLLQCMPHLFLWRRTSLQHQRQASQCQRLQQFLSRNTFLQLLRGMPHQLLWWSTSLTALTASSGVPASTAFAAPAPVVEHISPDPTVHVAQAPVVEYTSPDLAEYAVVEYAVAEYTRLLRWSLPKQLFTRLMRRCRDDFEELSCVARMSRKRLWRRVWHGCSSLSGASKSERSWRRLSKRLCFEEGFDKLSGRALIVACLRTKMTFWFVARDQTAACVRLTEIPGVFHGRCAAALGHSGGARWQICPWCPRAKPATVIGVDVSDEDVNFISMNFGALTIQR